MVLASSVAALPTHARQLFATLGAFASNDIGRDALRAIASALGDPDPQASGDALLDLRLADAYLSDAIPAEVEGGDRERLRLHPLVRAFARDLLDGARAVADDPPWPPERRALAERALAAWYADYANTIPDEALDPDEANIAGALAWAEAAREDRLLARICQGMANYWDMRGRTDARERTLPLAVAAAQRLASVSGARDDRLLAARLELSQANLLQQLGDLPAARRLAERSAATFAALDDQRGEGGRARPVGGSGAAGGRHRRRPRRLRARPRHHAGGARPARRGGRAV